jgi:phosphatidylethanolamine/phosphatidyl-N-methylethanolamine N-methyltransferase
MRPQPDKSSHDGYISGYDELNSSKTLASYFLSTSHKIMESAIDSDLRFSKVLEVGAGTGEHLKFVHHHYDQYYLTDQSEKMLVAARKKYATVSNETLILERQDASKLTYPDEFFDRLIATHVLEHLPNPVAVIQEWYRLVRKGGLISIVLPCDPGMLWRLGRHFGPRRNARRLGIEYDYLMATEHINSIYNLVVLIRYHFPQAREVWYPAKLPLSDLNLFYICNIFK